MTAFGIDIPVLALALSMTALVLARWVAPPPLRKLSKKEEVALTMLLIIFLFLAVTGHMPLIGNEKPLGPGMAVVWGAGLGFSGLLVVELMGDKVMAILRVAFGLAPKDPIKDVLDKLDG